MWIVLCGLASFAGGCGSAEPSSRDCRLGWSLDGEMVCEGDLELLAAEFRQKGVPAQQIRPGARYVRQGGTLRWVGELDPRWLRALSLPVWVHGDSRRRLRSLKGLGSRRLAALGRSCPALSCCDLLAVRGIGPKTIAAWGGKMVVQPQELPCLRWDGAMSLQPCVLLGFEGDAAN